MGRELASIDRDHLEPKVGGLRDALKRKRPASDIESLSNRYLLAEDALGRQASIPTPEARTGFVQWYLENYSPTTLQDIKWWTGLSGPIVREIVSFLQELVRIRVEGFPSPMIIPERQLRFLTVRARRRAQISLLPYEDPLPKGYILRERFGSKKIVESAFVGGSAAPTVLVNGRIVAKWKFAVEAGHTVSQIRMIEQVEKDTSEGIVDRARALADFLFSDKENRVSIA